MDPEKKPSGNPDLIDQHKRKQRLEGDKPEGSKKARKGEQLPRGEFQRNLGVPDINPGGSASNTPEDKRDWADRSPKAQDKFQRG
jgi:hypothetical protein